MDWVVLDFETASACDLVKCGAWRYAEDPTTEVLCCCYSVNGGPWEGWRPGEPFPISLSPTLNPNRTFVAFNAAFEKAILRRHMMPLYDWPDILNSRWHDIQAACAMKVLPQKLERAALVLRLPSQKDMEGSRLVKGLSKPNKAGQLVRTPEMIERTVQYCGDDIAAEVDLLNCTGWLPQAERNVWLLDQRINERGLRLDLPFIAAARKIVDDASVPLVAEFRDMTGGINPTQRDKVLGWIEGQGVTLPNMTKETLARVLGVSEDDDEEEIEDADPIVLPDNVRRALTIRQLVGSASIKKLARMELCVCSDGRARGLLAYHGAGPGRWAGRLLQPQNFPRGTIFVDGRKPDPQAIVDAVLTEDYQYVEAIIGPPVETVVSSLRHAIIAADGRALCAGDFAGIEARIVLSLAGQHDKTALMASGVDVYCDMASQIYKRPITKADQEERQTGKNSVLGLGFQMGWRKFKSRYAAKEDDEFCQRVVNIYRKEWAPGVPEVWYGLEGAAVRAVHDRRPQEAYGVRYELEDGWLTARLPSGRKLWYYNPTPCRKAMPWDETDVRLAWTYNAMKMGQWRTIDAFGGLLTENVVQGLARDLMVAAMFKCEQNGMPICLTVHDEIVTEPEIKDADPKTLQQIMEDVPGWAKALQIPVATEAWAGDRYRK